MVQKGDSLFQDENSFRELVVLGSDQLHIVRRAVHDGAQVHEVILEPREMLTELP
jgi:hypothetical protein